mmetsp:Transcript_22078/g.47597  ORF Transcript_22078/g.47597 Transcript_22078/m.47597 type:complete len:450 (+) Transcript_22078:413-1762(+)
MCMPTRRCDDEVPLAWDERPSLLQAGGRVAAVGRGPARGLPQGERTAGVGGGADDLHEGDSWSGDKASDGHLHHDEQVGVLLRRVWVDLQHLDATVAHHRRVRADPGGGGQVGGEDSRRAHRRGRARHVRAGLRHRRVSPLLQQQQRVDRDDVAVGQTDKQPLPGQPRHRRDVTVVDGHEEALLLVAARVVHERDHLSAEPHGDELMLAAGDGHLLRRRIVGGLICVHLRDWDLGDHLSEVELGEGSPLRTLCRDGLAHLEPLARGEGEHPIAQPLAARDPMPPARVLPRRLRHEFLRLLRVERDPPPVSAHGEQLRLRRGPRRPRDPRRAVGSLELEHDRFPIRTWSIEQPQANAGNECAKNLTGRVELQPRRRARRCCLREKVAQADVLAISAPHVQYSRHADGRDEPERRGNEHWPKTVVLWASSKALWRLLGGDQPRPRGLEHLL